jgi:hypothetical protein
MKVNSEVGSQVLDTHVEEHLRQKAVHESWFLEKKGKFNFFLELQFFWLEWYACERGFNGRPLVDFPASVENQDDVGHREQVDDSEGSKGHEISTNGVQ